MAKPSIPALENSVRNKETGAPTMNPIKGARALASAVLVLTAVSAVPAVSTAQEGGPPADPPAGATPDPADPGEGAAKGPGADLPDPAGTGTASADQSQVPAAPQSSPGVAYGSAGQAHASASATVTMGDFFFSPASATVAAGDTVTWRNTGQAPHNATADDGSFRTPDLNNGQSASHTFSRDGTFSYICTIHPNMHGTIRVVSSSTGGGGGGSAGSSSNGSSQSEASAVASPDAAGTSTSLPATGLAAGALVLAGLAMLAGGIALRRLDPDSRGALRFLTIY
jgi:plastocyanin